MRGIQKLRRCVTSMAALLMSLGVISATHAQEATQPVKAVWQVQEIFLSYLGFTSFYSCDGMRDRVSDWMKQIGAQDRSVVSIAGCDRASGPARTPSVRILIATPVAATPEAIAANANDPKRAAALAKLQKRVKTPLQDGTFDATRKTVVLLSKETPMVGAAGDCELLENLRDQVLKKVDARVVKDNLGCSPHQGTVGNPQLEVEVLTKA
jgi:hypothetical protein